MIDIIRPPNFEPSVFDLLRDHNKRMESFLWLGSDISTASTETSAEDQQSAMTIDSLIDAMGDFEERAKNIATLGIDIITTELLPPDYYSIEVLKATRHRSKRLWKKLVKRRRRSAEPMRISAIMFDNKMIMPSEMYNKIRIATHES